MLYFLQYALQSLWRRPWRVVAIIGVYTLVVGFYASVVFFVNALQQESDRALGHLPELWVQQLAGGRLVPMKQSWVDSLQGIRGVRQIQPRLWGYNYDSPTGAVFTLMAADTLPPEGLSLLKTLPQGQRLQPETAWVGTGLLEMRELALGDDITLFDDSGEIRSFRIVGAFEAAADLLTRDLIVLHPYSARKMLGLAEDEITDLAISIHNPDEINNIGRKIDRQFAGIRVVTADELRSTYTALFSWRGGLFTYGTLLSLLAFLILIWQQATGMTAEERRELGVLKAIGWEISDVLQVKFWEAIVLSFTATMLGMMLAYGHVFVLGAPMLKQLLMGWSVLYPQYVLHPTLDYASWLTILALSVVPYVAATVLPAWRAAIIPPAEVM
ncbi:ABC transporter permease [Eisenibacter elegans]|jgi:ABC-type lipoprotein release transport system permease subunit|uniref:ABC transporter permease n=1 Tax=Eisenibacter elegans TaxID=997 RepID=UPI000478E68A|nr:FtsX-like permease family protein [Eisenibacter elegans]